jgi:phospholipid/cholesterol/gamma-HCH transport system substrate-binding protein
MNSKFVELVVGLFLLAGILALGYLALRVGNMGSVTGGDSYRVTARFDNIGGLAVKAPVTLAGVRIGRVTAIDVDRELYSAVVTLEIDTAYDNLPLDTSASILTAGLLGAQYVGLDPGGDIEFLTDGDRIELTQSAVVLENLIGQLLFSKTSEN